MGTFIRNLPFIQRTGRQFQQVQAGCVTVLADEKQVAIFIHRNDDNRADMFDNIQPGLMAVWQPQGVTADGECTARNKRFQISVSLKGIITLQKNAQAKIFRLGC